MEKILPTNDLMFRKLYGSPEYEDIYRGIFSDFFGITPTEIIVTNPYSINDYKEILKNGKAVLREVIPDVSYSLKLDRFAEGLTELQIRKFSFFEERSVYYTFDRFCRNYNIAKELTKNPDGSINRYSSLKAVYTLNILGYNHFPDDDALRILELYDPIRNKKLNRNLLNIGYFELMKKNTETENQRHWQTFFLTGEAGPDAPEYIRHAAEAVTYVNLDEEEREMAIMLEKARADYDAGLADSYYEGEIKATINMIKKFNLPVEQAIRAAQLSDDNKDQIISELKRQNILYTL
jgi:hypothetical protein